MTATDRGSQSTYRNYECRCVACLEAHRVGVLSQRAKRYAARSLIAGRLVAVGVAEDRHGLATTYQNWGCRCHRCTAASSTQKAQWRARGGGDTTP